MRLATAGFYLLGRSDSKEFFHLAHVQARQTSDEREQFLMYTLVDSFCGALGLEDLAHISFKCALGDLKPTPSNLNYNQYSPAEEQTKGNCSHDSKISIEALRALFYKRLRDEVLEISKRRERKPSSGATNLYLGILKDTRVVLYQYYSPRLSRQTDRQY